jgi:hypothetical protein
MWNQNTNQIIRLKTKLLFGFVILLLLPVILAACGGGEFVGDENASDNDTTGNNTSNYVVGDDEDVSPWPRPTWTPRPTPQPSLTPYPEDRIEEWLVDLEWPDTIFLGESDVIRLTLTPSETGLVVEAEFSDHDTVTKEVPIARPSGYLLNAVAELQGSTFKINPDGPQSRELVTGKAETWHWSIEPEKPGRHRLFLSIQMEWIPLETDLPSEREFGVISHAFEIQVDSYYGLTKPQAYLIGSVLGLGLLGFVMLLTVSSPKGSLILNVIREGSRNPDVKLEPEPDIQLSEAEQILLQTIYNQYARVVIEKEFMSGYSGARTFMTTPVHADERADAYSIIKISGREGIQREYHNYQAYVKNTLPPTTARIQEPPVSVKGIDLAALRYTFIGAPGSLPHSLRQIMVRELDPDWFQQLAEGYGPGWWLQRSPYTFRLSKEYDRKLPAHYVIRPADGAAKTLDGRIPMTGYKFQQGEIIKLRHFKVTNINPSRERISLLAELDQGGVPVKVTYLSAEKPKEFAGEVVSTRQSVMEETAAELELFGLPDPLKQLPALLNQVITGSRSIIHGDLNLENILIGPGGVIWLIDFAETREGHTLYDFAHLYAETIAHLLSPQFPSPKAFLDHLAACELPLLNGLEQAAGSFLFNPTEKSEYKLAAAISCLGALKYANLDRHARQLLYLAAAFLIDSHL